VVFSTLGHLNVFAALLRRFLPAGTRLVAREAGLASREVKYLAPFVFPWLYRHAYPNCDAIICQSRAMQQDLVGSFGIREDRLCVIPNPVDGASIATRAAEEGPAYAMPPDRFNLLAVGRMKPVKGFDLLLDAVARLDSGSFHLTIVGDGPVRGALERQAKALGITGMCTFTGFQPNPFPYMRKADLLMLTSRHEGSPNTALEALALGTPVLALDNPGGTREIVRHGENGWLVPPGSASRLAEAVRTAAETHLPRDRFRQQIRSAHHPDRIVREYENVLLGSSVE
jgi:glycosyltransferase involved in cell wall biosynthesis